MSTPKKAPSFLRRYLAGETGRMVLLTALLFAMEAIGPLAAFLEARRAPGNLRRNAAPLAVYSGF